MGNNISNNKESDLHKFIEDSAFITKDITVRKIACRDGLVSLQRGVFLNVPDLSEEPAPEQEPNRIFTDEELNERAEIIGKTQRICDKLGYSVGTVSGYGKKNEGTDTCNLNIEGSILPSCNFYFHQYPSNCSIEELENLKTLEENRITSNIQRQTAEMNYQTSLLNTETARSVNKEAIDLLKIQQQTALVGLDAALQELKNKKEEEYYFKDIPELDLSFLKNVNVKEKESTLKNDDEIIKFFEKNKIIIGSIAGLFIVLVFLKLLL